MLSAERHGRLCCLQQALSDTLATLCKHLVLLLSLAAFDTAPRNINYSILVKKESQVLCSALSVLAAPLLYDE